MLNRTGIWILISLILASCSGGTSEKEELPGNLSEKIDYLIEDSRYETALEVLEKEDESDPSVLRLLEKTHLNYGIHNMNTFDGREMRTRMNDALRQFTEVLRINPANQAARSHIDQILQVYRTIPDRSPEEDVLRGLREVGITP